MPTHLAELEQKYLQATTPEAAAAFLHIIKILKPTTPKTS